MLESTPIYNISGIKQMGDMQPFNVLHDAFSLFVDQQFQFLETTNKRLIRNVLLICLALVFLEHYLNVVIMISYNACQ